MPHTATSLTSWAKAIKLTLDKAGVDGTSLFEQAGLDIELLNDPNARYALENTTRLWKLAVKATSNPCIGLDVGRNINHTTFHALGYSLLASPNLKDCFERLIRYFRIVTDAGDLNFSLVGNHYRFAINPIAGNIQPAEEAVEAFVSVIYGLCRALTAREFQADKVCFTRKAPSDTSPYDRAFKLPVEFNTDEVAMYIDKDLILKPLPAANAELVRINDEVLTRYLLRFDKQNICNRVHAALVQQLSQGEPSQEKISELLHVGTRNLQRKLSAEGTSYKEILNQTRKDLAMSYMGDSSLSISEITFLLGFSDTSSFTRAFKRWAGVPPTEYRR